MTTTNDKFHGNTITLKNHQLAIKMLTKAFIAHTKVFHKYSGFYDTYTRAFEDFLSELDAFPNVYLTRQIIDTLTLER